MNFNDALNFRRVPFDQIVIGVKMKKKPKGFIATCQCGEVVGAMDYVSTERREAGKLLGEWLTHGCTVSPKFDGNWSVKVTACKCE